MTSNYRLFGIGSINNDSYGAYTLVVAKSMDDAYRLLLNEKIKAFKANVDLITKKAHFNDNNTPLNTYAYDYLNLKKDNVFNMDEEQIKQYVDENYMKHENIIDLKTNIWQGQRN